MNTVCRSIGAGLLVLDVCNTGVTDDFLRSVRTYNPHLTHLIAGDNDFSDAGIIAMVDSNNMQYPLLKLIELDVSNSYGVGDCGVLSICGAYSQTLQVLNIAHLEDRFSVKCLHCVTQSLVQLKLLDLRFCGKKGWSFVLLFVDC